MSRARTLLAETDLSVAAVAAGGNGRPRILQPSVPAYARPLTPRVETIRAFRHRKRIA